MNTIRDMIYVKRLERRLGRRLTDEEMSGEEFIIPTADGRGIEFCAVPILNFPTDLLSAPECFISESQGNEF